MAEVDARFRPTGRDYPAGYRDNDRALLDDALLARRMFERIREALPAQIVDEDGEVWRLAGLNPRFRFCRYRDGQKFSIHRDGAHANGDRERSRLTVMLYLNDASEFAGGLTRFYTTRDGTVSLGAIVPERGMAVIFDHDLWHDGQAVTSGTKMVMRSDVMYTREERGDRPDLMRGHTGYVWSLCVRRDGRLVSGSRDRTIRVWPGERLTGHEGSVSAVVEAADGRLWSGSRDRTIRRWPGGEIVGRHEGAVLWMSPLPDGRVASSGADGAILLWPDGFALQGHRGWVWALAPFGDRLASVSEDGTLRLWDLTWRCELRQIALPGARALAPFGNGLACGHEDGTITLLDKNLDPIASGKIHDGAINALLDLGGGRLASGGEDDFVRVTRGLTQESAHRHGAFVRCLALLPNGKIASGGYDGQIRLW
jgi:WD40 repeat protein